MVEPSPTPPGQEIIETTEVRFRQDVIEESLRKLVIVNIWSETQAACKEIKSHLERLIDAAPGKVRLAHLNIASGQSIAGQLGITSAPAVIAFQRGRPVDGFVGALPADQIKGFWNVYLDQLKITPIFSLQRKKWLRKAISLVRMPCLPS